MSEEYNFNGYENNGYENEGYGEGTSSQIPPQAPKKKRRIITGIAAAVAGIFLIAGIAGAAVSGLGAGKNNENRKPDTTLGANTEDGTVSSETGENAGTEGTQDADKQHYTLSKADQIDTTDLVKTTSVLDVSDVVEEVMPSVVAIVNTLQYSNGFQTGQTPSSGTGVIVAKDDDELLVVTNAHVVDEESSTSYYYSVDSVGLTVTFYGDTSAEAYVKGVDKEADLAVIAVKISDLSEETLSSIKIASIGDSTEAKMGNGVIAIGNALGYGQSVTVGHISALNREVTFSDGYTRNLMQIDAAINPGNSGGGLFDVYGRLIGINESKTVSEDVEGIGFAIPISEAEDIITTLMNTVPRTQYSEEERGYLGISGMTVPSDYVRGGYPEGAVIFSLVEGSPAETAGLQLQDIIVGVGEVEITSMTELSEELSYYKAGDTVVLHVKRIERNQFVDVNVSVTLGDKSLIENTEESTEETQPIAIPGF